MVKGLFHITQGIIFLPCFVLLYQQMSAKIYTHTEGLVSLFLCRKAQQGQLLKPDINQHLYQGGISDHWKRHQSDSCSFSAFFVKDVCLKEQKNSLATSQGLSSAWLLKMRLGYKVVVIATS